MDRATKPMIGSEWRDNILYLTLQRPERHNALVPELLDDLNRALDEAVQVPPKCLVLAAEGSTFSTGGDVQAFSDTPRDRRTDYARLLVGSLHEAILRLVQLPCPTVARVHGLVTGGSCGLLMACDLVALDARAHWTPWYLQVGFSPDGGWTALMADRIGRHRTLAVHLLNRSISAREAVDWGLADAVVSSTEAMDQVIDDWMAHLGQRAPGAAALTRQRLRPDVAWLRRQLDTELQDFVAQITTAEAEQSMRAFLSSTRTSTDNRGDAGHGTV